MQFIQTRLKFITTFMGVIIILCLSIVYSKFGSGVLEDNFVARLYTDYASATHFLAFYALLNLYIYLMVYVYGPCGHKEGGRWGKAAIVLQRHHVIKRDAGNVIFKT